MREAGMLPYGIADSVQLSVLTKALNDYCEKHRIKCKEERERTYRNQSDEPFRAGVDDPDQLAEELEQVG